MLDSLGGILDGWRACFLAPKLLAFLVFPLVVGCGRQEEAAKELLRRRKVSEVNKRLGDESLPQIEVLAKKLTEAVIAEKEEGSGYWVISQPDSDSFVKVPFLPVSGAKTSARSPSGEGATINLNSQESDQEQSSWLHDGLLSLVELKQTLSKSNRNPGFLGAKVCRECHQERHASFIHTGHHLTSGWMPSYPDSSREGHVSKKQRSAVDGEPYEESKESVVHGAYFKSPHSNSYASAGVGAGEAESIGGAHLAGGFKDSKENVEASRTRMQSKDPDLSFQMLRDHQGFHQAVKIADYQLSLPIHAFTGSAKAGQTFLYWHEQRLYQSFVSYLTDLDQWIPSPGYFDTTVDYTREIGTTCLECHVTYIEAGDERGTLKPDSAVWGISCERCHGPGRDHVDYHRQFPDVRQAKHITQPADLSRQRQLDICSQCHSGRESLITGKFSFRPGMKVRKSSVQRGVNEVGGVHTANQLNRLSMSRCFQRSEMTCTTCHNPHVNQRGFRDVFSTRCMECHQPDHCGASERVGPSIIENCIDCHMPTGANDQMTIEVGGGDRFTVRMIDHHIHVNAEATDQFLQQRAELPAVDNSPAVE